jgi:hypothetical protein
VNTTEIPHDKRRGICGTAIPQVTSRRHHDAGPRTVEVSLANALQCAMAAAGFTAA